MTDWIRDVFPGYFDGDYASMSFSNEDAATVEAFDGAIHEAIVTNPRIMREMPRLLPKAGLELIASFS